MIRSKYKPSRPCDTLGRREDRRETGISRLCSHVMHSQRCLFFKTGWGEGEEREGRGGEGRGAGEGGGGKQTEAKKVSWLYYFNIWTRGSIAFAAIISGLTDLSSARIDNISAACKIAHVQTRSVWFQGEEREENEERRGRKKKKNKTEKDRKKS